MSFWIWWDGGHSMPQAGTWRQRLALRVGRYLAVRHPGVEVHPSARVSPQARIHPREGSIRIGPGCVIAAGAILQGPIELGENCSVQTGAILVGYGESPGAAGLIRIGNNVRIAPFVQMIAADHRFGELDRPITGQGLEPAPITVADDVWVAGRAMLMAGVTVGTGSVVAAGAVVTRDVPPWSIVGGVPAKLLRSRKP